jgi:hypothetical protein
MGVDCLLCRSFAALEDPVGFRVHLTRSNFSTTIPAEHAPPRLTIPFAAFESVLDAPNGCFHVLSLYGCPHGRVGELPWGLVSSAGGAPSPDGADLNRVPCTHLDLSPAFQTII